MGTVLGLNFVSSKVPLTEIKLNKHLRWELQNCFNSALSFKLMVKLPLISVGAELANKENY